MTGEGSGGAGSPPPKTFTEDQLNSMIAEKERQWTTREAELKAKASKWDEYESKGKSEIQRLTEKAAADAARAAKAEQDLANYRTAQENEKHRAKYGEKYNLEKVDWGRIPGSNEQEIEASAKVWAKEKGRDKVGGFTPAGAAGESKQNPNARVNNLIAQAAGYGGR